MANKDWIEKVIIHSDLYQTFIGDYVDYSSVEKKLASAIRQEALKRLSEEKIEETINGVSEFHNHQDHPMPKRYWKFITKSIHTLVANALGGK